MWPNIRKYVVLAILLFLRYPLAAQSDADIITDAARYQLKLAQMDILRSIKSLSSEQLKMLQEADGFARAGEYEFAIIYLDELLAQLAPAEKKRDSVTGEPKKQATWQAISGVDFNRQEFEMSFSQQDSTLLGEIGKPYFGWNANLPLWQQSERLLALRNGFRVDFENIRADYQLRYDGSDGDYVYLGGYLNYNKIEIDNSFWEQVLQSRLTVATNRSWRLNYSQYLNYKLYRGTDESFGDFYRLRTDIQSRWQLTPTMLFDVGLQGEMNEYLGRDDNDYRHGAVRLTFSDRSPDGFSWSFGLEPALRRYSYSIDDSTIFNRYNQWTLESWIQQPISSRFRFELEDRFIRKIYGTPSSLEPDYNWNYLRPAIIWTAASGWEFGLGYEWEWKLHNIQEIEGIDVTEQNYNSNGPYFQLNWFSPSGLYISLNGSYQWRRFPDSATNDLFSLYSNRNILSVFAVAMIPLHEKLALQVFANYDNDTDIDRDQENSQSIIFTAELQYTF